MSGYDVHTDKALKELRARLDQAERERGELHAALRNVLAALGNGSGATDAASVEFLTGAPREVAAVVGELRRERDEAGRAFRDLVAVLDRDGGQRQAGETIAGTLERAIRVAADAVVGADALREERDEARAALAAVLDAADADMAARRAVLAAVGSGLDAMPAARTQEATSEQLDAALRAARGAS